MTNTPGPFSIFFEARGRSTYCTIEGYEAAAGYIEPGAHELATGSQRELILVTGGLVLIRALRQREAGMKLLTYEAGQAFDLPAATQLEIRVDPEGLDYVSFPHASAIGTIEPALETIDRQPLSEVVHALGGNVLIDCNPLEMMPAPRWA